MYRDSSSVWKIKSLSLLFAFFIFSAYPQQDSSSYCIAFYNVENLFHPDDDPEKADESFTPEGFNRWTYKRYIRKVNQIAKVILAMNSSHPPDMLGLAEVENAKALQQLCFYSPLKNFDYGYIHYESPDNRGIDVALLYRKKRVEILESKPVPIIFPFDSTARNRDILYVLARLPTGDTLHVFVNHWTSRFGGYAATIPKRNHYAATLRQKTDSLFRINPKSAIIIMGDFNDYPYDESLSKILGAVEINLRSPEDKLINMMLSFNHLQNIGTHKYEDFWGCLDQIVVSAALLTTDDPLQIEDYRAEIVMLDFLLEEDAKYGGVKPFRTFLGPRYKGGYADHLPVMVRVRKKN